MSDHVKSELDGGVLSLTIDRPEKKNALTQDMYGALADAILRVETEKGVRVLHVTGTGDMFTAGNDIADFRSGAADGEETEVVRFLRALVATDVPIVAAVNGTAVGVGVTMLLHTDFAYAVPEARFITPFIDLGVVPEAASSLTMPLQMGYKRAAEMLMLNERFDAEQAARAGIVNEVVEAGELLQRSKETARRLAAKPGQALRTTKRLMRLAPEPLADRMKVELREFGLALRSPESREAMLAFTEKREPDFSRFG